MARMSNSEVVEDPEAVGAVQAEEQERESGPAALDPTIPHRAMGNAWPR